MESLNSYTSWLSARCPRPPGKREISKWTKIWWIFLGHALFAGRIWEEDISTAVVEELKKLDASEIYPRRLNAKEVLITQKDGELVISCGRWFCKIIKKRLRIPRTHSETGIHRKERISAENLTATGKSFNLKNQSMTQKLRKTLVDSREFHLLSSFWTESSIIVLAEKRIIPYFTRFTSLKETPPRRNYRSGRSVTKI